MTLPSFFVVLALKNLFNWGCFHTSQLCRPLQPSAKPTQEVAMGGKKEKRKKRKEK
jgi:hypothetical protein